MWTLQDAKNRFSAVVDAALAGTPQSVSRRGKPVVVVLSETDYRALIDQAKTGRGPFTTHLLNFPAEQERKLVEEPAPAERVPVRPRDVAF